MISSRREHGVTGGREHGGTGGRWAAGLALLLLGACAASETEPRAPAASPAPLAAAPATAAPATAAPVATAVPTPPREVPRPEASADARRAPEPAPTSPATPDASAPDAPDAPPTRVSQKPDDVEGANLRMSGMTADGVSLSDILCRTEGGAFGGIFGGLTVAVGFKARKAQLDACAPKGAVETRVKWTASGGRMTGVKASGPSPQVNRCVERALAGAPGTLAGACAATVKHGRP